jgi:2'-5' RNA ligase/GNAT superfamily N-acetyltransferase
VVGSISFADVLSQLFPREKRAEIKRDAAVVFLYVALPDDLRRRLEGIGANVLPSGVVRRDVDHVTLVHVPALDAPLSSDRLDGLLAALREVGDGAAPIRARLQGWAYFDDVEDDGRPATALVGLVDAPGLEDLHVELKSACRREGFEPSDRHVFVPHLTFAYLALGRRVDALPRLDAAFDIDKVMLANADIHAIPLRGAAPVKTAREHCDRCSSPATVRVLWAEGHGYRPACEKHKEAVAAPYRAKDDFSGFKKYVEPAHHSGFGNRFPPHPPAVEAEVEVGDRRVEPRDQLDTTVGHGETAAYGTGGLQTTLKEAMSKLAGALPDGYYIQADIDPARKPRANRFNVYHGAENVGYAVTRPVREGTGTQLNSLLVKPAHRGKGLASALVRAAIESHPDDDIWLRARPFGDKPQVVHRLEQMYRRHGFESTPDGRMVLRRGADGPR